MKTILILGLFLGCLGWILYQILHRRSVRLNIRVALEKTFLDVAACLNQHEISWFLDYGTLLGYSRDGQFMDHEYDVDMSIHETEIPRLIEALKTLPAGYYLQKPQGGDFTKWAGFSVKIRHKNRRGNLDIYVYYSSKQKTLCQGKACQLDHGKLVACVPVPQENFWELPEDWFFPLQKTTFSVQGFSVSCYIPRQAQRYIEHLYGRDLTPDMVGFLGNRVFIRRFWAFL